jgi:hypothetical protein
MLNTNPSRSLMVRVQQMLEIYPETKQREWKCCGNSYDTSQIVNHLTSEQCSKREKPWTMIPEICRDGCELPAKIWFKWFNESEVGYEYKCSCKINKWLEEQQIKKVEYKTETNLIIEFQDGKVEEITIDNSQLEKIRDYYQEKQEKEQSETKIDEIIPKLEEHKQKELKAAIETYLKKDDWDY